MESNPTTQHLAHCARVLVAGSPCDCAKERELRSALVDLMLGENAQVADANFEQGFTKAKKVCLAHARGDSITRVDLVDDEVVVEDPRVLHTGEQVGV